MQFRMRIQDNSLNVSEKAAVAAADVLYQAVSKFYPNRPLFFLQLDELYMEICESNSCKDTYLKKMVRERWPKYFSKVDWTTDIDKLTDQYQRSCRKWVWSIFTNRQLTAADLQSMRAVVQIHERLLQGAKTTEIASYGNRHMHQELYSQIGKDDMGIPMFVKYLEQTDYDSRLNIVIDSYGKNVKEMKKICIDQPDRTLQFAQDTLLWMGIISMQVQDEQFEQKTIQEKVRLLLPDVWDLNNAGNTNALVEHITKRLCKNNKLPTLLMKIPYAQIRDTSIRTKAKIQFCTVYTIACTKGKDVVRQEVINSAAELIRSSFAKTVETKNAEIPIGNVVNRYCDLNQQEQIAKEVSGYFQHYYDLIANCFENMRKLDEDLISSVENEIASQKIRAAEDIAVMYQEREDEAYGKLMEVLSSSMHGNVIGQMYLIAEGKKKVDNYEAERLLSNFFLLMQQKMIMPVWNEHSIYPGWSIRGKIMVKAAERRDENR